MRNVTKAICILLVLGMLGSSLVACGSTSSKQEPASSSDTVSTSSNATPSLEKYDLKILSAGDTPPDNDLVCQEISNVSKDELNINLSITYTPWADYVEKTKLAASAGEQFDIFLQFLGELQSSVARKQAIAIDDLIAEHGSDLLKVIDKGDWADVTISGKIYGVPSVYVSVFMQTMIIRKDLREKYGLHPINTLADLEAYFEAIKANEEGMIPFTDNGRITSPIVRMTDYANDIPEAPYFRFTGSVGDAPLVSIDGSKKPYVVENYFKSESCRALVKWTAKAYKNGWIDKDILLKKDPFDLFTSGKAAATYGCLYNLPDCGPKLEKNVPGAQIELVMPYADKKVFKTAPTCNNMACVSGTSKNPERAVMFLNWLRKSKENYDLFMLGIKGKHWNPVGDDKAELIGVTDLTKRPYAPTPWWTEQMNWDRSLTIDFKPYSDAVKLYSSKPYEVSSLAQFTVNTENIKTEMAQLATVIAEKMVPVLCGVKGTDADYQAAIEAIDNAGIDKVIADIQKQVDDYSAKTGK